MRLRLLAYVRIGRVVYRLLRQRFPELAQVPIEDVLSVAEELIRTPSSLEDAAIVSEPAAAHLFGVPTPAAAHLRLVIRRQRTFDGE